MDLSLFALAKAQDGLVLAGFREEVLCLVEAGIIRRAVLRLFVRRELMDVETAQGMLAWPHSGFHVHDGVWIAAEDREFAVRLARYCARNPVALSRLEYQPDNATVTYHSNKCRSNLFRLARFSLGLRRRHGHLPL